MKLKRTLVWILPAFLLACNLTDTSIGTGYAPTVEVSYTNSAVSLGATQVLVGGSTTVTLSLRDANFNPYQSSGSQVIFQTGGGNSVGVFGAIHADGNGNYSSTFTGVTAGSATRVQAFVNDHEIQSLAPSITVLPHSTLTQNVFQFLTTNSSDFTVDSGIDFNAAGGVCELVALNQTDDVNSTVDSASGFNAGISAGLQWDPALGVVRLNNHGGCDGSSVDCAAASAYRPDWTPQFSHIVALWHLNETSAAGGIVTDASGHGNSGTINSGVTPGASGKIGTAYAFNGASGQVTLNQNSGMNFGTGPFSISAWFKKNSNSVRGDIFNWKSNSGSPDFGVFVDGGILTVFLNGYLINSGPTVAANQWHQFVLTRDGSGNIVLYLDGAQYGTAINHDDFSNWAGIPVILGSNHGGSYTSIAIPFDGNINEVAMWNSLLSATEVQSIYTHQNQTKSGVLTSRVLSGGSTAANWTSLGWTTTLPFLKNLTTTNETASNYSGSTNAAGAAGDSELATGLVSLWHFDEANGAGTILDAKGGNSLTPTNISLGTPGKLNTSASFDGTSSYAVSTLSSSAINGASAMTAAVWVRANPTSGTQEFMRQETSLALRIEDAAGHAIFYLGDGASFYSSGNSTTLINDGNWHHVAGVYDGDYLKIYVDGQMQNSSRPGAHLVGAGTEPIYFGEFKAGTEKLSGSLDEAALWSRALGASEILALYRRGANRIKFQTRTCLNNDCSDDTTNSRWTGSGATAASTYSELNNPNPASPNLTFSNFTTPTPAATPYPYFQYRAVLESDDQSNLCNYGSTTFCSPELKSVHVGPNHYPVNAPAIVAHHGVSFHSLSNVIETLGAGACASGVVYNLGIGTSSATASWYYWNGSAWIASGGTASTANSATSLNAAVGTALTAFGNQFPAAGSVYLKAFLQSSGSSACELQSFEFDGSI